MVHTATLLASGWVLVVGGMGVAGRVDSAELKDGLLNVALVREVPEAMKPRRIEIRSDDTRYIEGHAEKAA